MFSNSEFHWEIYSLCLVTRAVFFSFSSSFYFFLSFFLSFFFFLRVLLKNVDLGGWVDPGGVEEGKVQSEYRVQNLFSILKRELINKL